MTDTGDLTGLRFGRLTVLSPAADRTRLGRPQWACLCDCGVTVSRRGDGLRSGRTISCGCGARELARRQMTRHGQARTPEYRAWQMLRQRCLNPQAADYPDYGGRGIAVCDRWRDSFEAFFADVGPRPSVDHSLDRKDNDGPYAPGNCRWTTAAIQHRNHRRNNLLTYNGRTMTVTDWAAELGVPAPTVTGRLRRGWELGAALTTPPDEASRNRRSSVRQPRPATG